MTGNFDFDTDASGDLSVIELLEAGRCKDLTPEQVLEAAWDYNHGLLESRHYEDAWLTPFFNLVRVMKAYPPFATLTAGQACRLWREHLDEVGEDWTSVAPDMDSEEVNEEFQRTWAKVECSVATTPLIHAEFLARKEPVEVIEPNQLIQPGYAKFLSLACRLQILRGDQNVLLPVEEVAKVLSTEKKQVNKMRVSRWLNMAMAEKLIVLVKKHSLAANRAAEYRVDLSRFRKAAKHS
jgi:hypothetical protein